MTETPRGSGLPAERATNGYAPPERPTTRIAPERPTIAAASRSVASLPTKSSTTSAPKPSVIATIVSANTGSSSERDIRPRPRGVDRFIGDVGRDDARRGRRAQDLRREIAEPAEPDDHRGRPRMQEFAASPDRMIGRERGVGQRGGDRGIEIADRTSALAGALTYSAMPPFFVTPGVGGGLSRPPVRRQAFCRPARHALHAPHDQHG